MKYIREGSCGAGNDKFKMMTMVEFLKPTLQNYYEILKICFLGTTWTVMLPSGSNLQPHTGVLSVAIVNGL